MVTSRGMGNTWGVFQAAVVCASRHFSPVAVVSISPIKLATNLSMYTKYLGEP